MHLPPLAHTHLHTNTHTHAPTCPHQIQEKNLLGRLISPCTLVRLLSSALSLRSSACSRTEEGPSSHCGALHIRAITATAAAAHTETALVLPSLWNRSPQLLFFSSVFSLALRSSLLLLPSRVARPFFLSSLHAFRAETHTERFGSSPFFFSFLSTISNFALLLSNTRIKTNKQTVERSPVKSTRQREK